MKYVSDELMARLQTVSLYSISDTSVFSEKEMKKIAPLFDDGSKKFRKVIQKLHQKGIYTVASCIGHENDERGYFAFQVNSNNFYDVLDIVVGLAQNEDIEINTSTFELNNPIVMAVRFNIEDRDKIYDKILKWQIGKNSYLQTILSKQYYIMKMIGKRTSFLHEIFTVNLNGENVELTECNHLSCSIKNFKDYDADCQNALKIRDIISSSNSLTTIYEEIKKIQPLSGEKKYWLDFDNMSKEALVSLLKIVQESHVDFKIVGMENSFIQSLYYRFHKRSMDLKIPIDMRNFYNILIDLEEYLKIKIAKINYQQMKNGKSY